MASEPPNSPRMSKINGETRNQHCDACKYQLISSDATAYCTVCSEYLCRRCKRAHTGSRASRDHIIVSISVMKPENGRTKPVPSNIYCDYHKSMPLKDYCKSHEEIVCGTCKITNHRKCNFSDIREQSLQMKKTGSFKETVKGLVNLRTKYEKLKERRSRDKETLRTQLHKCLIDMSQMRKDIADIFDELERKCWKDIALLEERLTSDIESHTAIADDALTQINKHIKSMVEYHSSHDEDVMFIGMTKANLLCSKYSDTISHMQHKIQPIRYQFEPKMFRIMRDMVQQLKSFDPVLVNESIEGESEQQISLMSLAVGQRQGVSIGSYHAFGCTFMPDGHLVMACGRNGLKLLDKDLNMKSQLSEFSFQVTPISDTEVVVTQGTLKNIKVVTVLPNMNVLNTLSMDRNCYGVDVYGDEIYVTCHDNPGKGEIQVLNMEGQFQRSMSINDDRYKLIAPSYIQVSKAGDKVFVSDRDTDTVTCLSQQGHVIYRYSDRNFKVPTGILVDGDDNILVCGYQSFNLHLVRSNGKKEKVLITTTHGVECPLCVAYRPRDGRLAVGLDTYTDKALVVINTEDVYGQVT